MITFDHQNDRSMKTRYAFFAVLTCAAAQAMAQTYCSPTFLNGCFSWYNQSISVDAVDWMYDGDCNNTDHTATTAAVIAGVPIAMTVTSGNWTGCAVWVDLDNDGAFSDAENLYYTYVGGEPYTYTFNITIPIGTTPNPYRMRVLAPWGSDGFSDTNTNGYGACGDFQYGNFTDLTLMVETSTGLQTQDTTSPLVSALGGAHGLFMLQGEGQLIERTILAMDGRVIEKSRAQGPVQGALIDLSQQPDAVYLLHCITDRGPAVIRVVKQ